MKRRLSAIGLSFASGTAAPSPSDTRTPTCKQASDLLAVACPGRFSLNGRGARCRPCPAFIDAGCEDAFNLETAAYGRFLGRAETEAMLDFSGGEPHGANLGGTLILRSKGLTNWALVRFEEAVRTNDCLKYCAADGHGLLVRQTFYANMGYGIEGLGGSDLVDANRP